MEMLLILTYAAICVLRLRAEPSDEYVTQGFRRPGHDGKPASPRPVRDFINRRGQRYARELSGEPTTL